MAPKTGIGTRTDSSHVTYQIARISTGGTGRFADANATYAFTMCVHTLSIELCPPRIAHNDLEGTLDGQLGW
jgi:hypothetical protein